MVSCTEGFIGEPLPISQHCLSKDSDTRIAAHYGYPQYKVSENESLLLHQLSCWALPHHGRQLLSDLQGDRCLPWSKWTNNPCKYPRGRQKGASTPLTVFYVASQIRLHKVMGSLKPKHEGKKKTTTNKKSSLHNMDKAFNRLLVSWHSPSGLTCHEWNCYCGCQWVFTFVPSTLKQSALIGEKKWQGAQKMWRSEI